MIDGWTGRKCPTCKGHGRNEDETGSCPACAGTGDEYGELDEGAGSPAIQEPPRTFAGRDLASGPDRIV